jgi:hypothetical protein
VARPAYRLHKIGPRLAVLAIAANGLSAQAVADAKPRQLSDADLIAYAARPFDKQAMMEQHIVVGVHRGVPVIADFPCSDVCPNYTTRIIHYDLAPGPACTAAGGVVQSRRVPYSIAMIEKDFCVPRPLATEH